jgi:hypothetical protein
VFRVNTKSSGGEGINRKLVKYIIMCNWFPLEPTEPTPATVLKQEAVAAFHPRPNPKAALGRKQNHTADKSTH